MHPGHQLVSLESDAHALQSAGLQIAVRSEPRQETSYSWQLGHDRPKLVLQ